MSPRRVVVVGASLAGLNALQAARRSGFAGELVLVGAETHLPYDRPPLSKALLDRDELPTPHLPGAHELENVELHLGKPARALDVAQRQLLVGDDDLEYDALVIATGVRARTLPGADKLRGILTLRTLDDALVLRAALARATKVVVIGAGFIGAEVAAAARKRGLDVTILEATPIPLGRVLGETAAKALVALHEQRGTHVECGVEIAGFEGTSSVMGVRTKDDRVFPADLVVVGIGAQPNTEWLVGAGLQLDNGIVCDETLLAAPHVWAAGDVARWPNAGVMTRVEHWTNAVDQGVHAMTNALDPEHATPYRAVPYFWSDWYEHAIQFAGVAKGEPILAAGAWDDGSFTALYADGDRLSGVLTLNRRADIMKFRALLARGASMADAEALAASRRGAARS